jgi:tRNA G18 (ribose-2'-O)-methylase SpoU
MSNGTAMDLQVFVLGRGEKEGIPINLIQVLDACMEISQLGVISSLNVHVSVAIH